MIEKITEDEIKLMECLTYPISAVECVFSDLENCSHEPKDQLGHIRFGQIPMLSNEYMIDYDNKLTKKENFKLREGAGNIDCFGGRLFGKTWVVEVIDILLAIIHLDNEEAGFSSSDIIHIKAILEEKLIPILENHPFYQAFEARINRNPNYRISMKNGFTLIGINMNLQAKNPGQHFFGKHLKRLYIEEASFETEKVYNKRIDAVSELGCVTRSAGMTTFTPYSPSGKRFYSEENRPWVCNLPQYVNPNWNEEQKKKAIKKHGGENSISYRVFVKGEVVEDGISVFDMDLVKKNYIKDKLIKHFEITKKNFEFLDTILVLDRPEAAEISFVCADIGESAPTEIIIIFKIGEKYKYSYNITCYGLTDKEQEKVFNYVIQKVQANYTGLDTTDGTGRAIYRRLAETYKDDSLVWVGFNEKTPIDFERNEFDQPILDNDGKPKFKEEYVSEWSVKILKDLFYDNLFSLPMDYKLDQQINSVVATKSGARTVYAVVGEEDHLFAAFRVFGITKWKLEFANAKPMNKKTFGKTGVI